MIGYIKSTVVLISQLKGAVHPLVLTDQGIYVVLALGRALTVPLTNIVCNRKVILKRCILKLTINNNFNRNTVAYIS